MIDSEHYHIILLSWYLFNEKYKRAVPTKISIKSF